jgi:hypothetical protein
MENRAPIRARKLIARPDILHRVSFALPILNVQLDEQCLIDVPGCLWARVKKNRRRRNWACRHLNRNVHLRAAVAAFESVARNIKKLILYHINQYYRYKQISHRKSSTSACYEDSSYLWVLLDKHTLFLSFFRCLVADGTSCTSDTLTSEKAHIGEVYRVQQERWTNEGWWKRAC